MSQGRRKSYTVYCDAEKISLEEIILESEKTDSPSLKVKVVIDGHRIENVTFKRDIIFNNNYSHLYKFGKT